MLAIKSRQGLGSGLLLANGISPLIPTLFLSLLFLYSSVALLPQVGLLLGSSQQGLWLKRWQGCASPLGGPAPGHR